MKELKPHSAVQYVLNEAILRCDVDVSDTRRYYKINRQPRVDVVVRGCRMTPDAALLPSLANEAKFGMYGDGHGDDG